MIILGATTVVLPFLWAGLVLGVSFLATPVKFRAASLSLPVALEVGSHTFHLLTRVEVGLGLVLAAVAWLPAGSRSWSYVLWCLPLALVLVQIVAVLPPLDARLRLIVDGGTPDPSHLHLVYVGLESAKVCLLIGLGIWALAQR